MENSIKMDDLGVPLFLETPIYENSHLKICYLKKITQLEFIDFHNPNWDISL